MPIWLKRTIIITCMGLFVLGLYRLTSIGEARSQTIFPTQPSQIQIQPVASPQPSSSATPHASTHTPTASIPRITPSPVGSANSKGENGLVTRVIDGDTIIVILDGQEQKVRLIGIDAPESVDPKKPKQCYGQEASQDANKLLLGQSVTLESDSTQQNTDFYGRLLRYIYLNNSLINKTLLDRGDAKEYTFKGVAYKFQAEFKQAQTHAQASHVGLWGECSKY